MQKQSIGFDERFQHIKSLIEPSFDLVARQLVIEKQRVALFFLSSLSDSEMIKDLIDGMMFSILNLNKVACVIGSIEQQQALDQGLQGLLSGQCLLIIENDHHYYLVETRSYPTSDAREVENEKSVRGSSDAFVQNIILNVGLLRRRLRVSSLRIDMYKVGQVSKNDLVLAYIAGIAKQELVDDLIKRIENIKHKEILNDRVIVEGLYGKSINPYPHVRYCERSDLCATHLLQGYIVLLMDNIPGAIILPTTYFELCKQVEEYTQMPLIAIFTRLIRLLGILFSLYLLPLWISFVVERLPTMMNLEIKEMRLIEFGVGILLAEIVVEWIRMCLIHTPTMLSSIMSFIAIFVLGDMAIELGAYSKAILIMIAICNLGSLMTPNYEVSLANKVFRILISFFAFFGGVSGLCMGILFHFCVLLNTKTSYYPYLYPFIPFSYREIKRIFISDPIDINSKQQE